MKNRYILMDEAGDGTGAAGGGSGDGAAAPDAANGTGQILDGGQNGEGGNIVEFGADGYQYAGKYESPQALEEGYKESVAHHTKKMGEMNDKLKGFVGAPETGEYVVPEGANAYSAPVMESLSKWGAEQGLSQEAYDSLLGSIAAAEVANLEAYKTEQNGLLGHNAEARIQNVNDKWTAKYGEDATEWMNSKAMSAQDVEMFESILANGVASTVNPDGGQPQGEVMITQTQLSEAMFKKDSAGMILMQTDPAYKKLVDDMTTKYNKQRGIA